MMPRGDSCKEETWLEPAGLLCSAVRHHWSSCDAGRRPSPAGTVLLDLPDSTTEPSKFQYLRNYLVLGILSQKQQMD